MKHFIIENGKMRKPTDEERMKMEVQADDKSETLADMLENLRQNYLMHPFPNQAHTKYFLFLHR